MEKVNIQNLIQLFLEKEDEDSYVVQETYKKYLDKIIDAILVIRYEEERQDYDFYTINQLDEYIKNHLDEVEELAEKLASCTKRKSKIPYYQEKLEKISKYQKQEILTRDLTTDFYNEILNDQQNAYFSRKKKKIIHKLTKKLSLTDKKRKNLENGPRLTEIKKAIKEKDYESINIKEDDLLANLEQVHMKISKTKSLSRDYQFSQKDYEYFDYLFLKSKLKGRKLEEKYPFFNKRQLNKICNKYNQILLPYAQDINIPDKKISRVNVGYQLNHVKFYDFSTHYGNVLAFIDSLNYSEIDTLISQYEYTKILFSLLPLVDLLSGFEMNVFKNIVLHYPKIKEFLIEKQDFPKNPSLDTILRKLPSIIKLSNVYSHADCYTYSILKEETIDKILNTMEPQLEPYIKAYMGMLSRSYNTIPPLAGEYDDYVYESGTADRERLLIGLDWRQSCVTANSPGSEAFYQVLTKKNADVLMIRNKKTDCVVARSLLFRKNNFIIMAPIYDKNLEEMEIFYHREFLSQISSQFLALTKEKDDRLDYVLLTKHFVEVEDYPVLTSDLFEDSFPHNDLNIRAYLIGISEEVRKKGSNIEFTPRRISVKPTGVYEEKRRKVEVKRENYQEDIKEIKALEIVSTSNTQENRKLKEEFAFLLDANFDEVYIGQDWYLALKEKEILSKGVFKTSDKRQQEEIKAVEENLLLNNKNSINRKREGNILQKIKRKK